MDIDEFRAFDARWSRLLRGPSLVSEAGIDIEESFAALQFIACLYEQYSHSRRNRTHILAMYPATVLTGLTAVASDKYDEGTFWPKVENVAEIEMGQTQQNEFSEAFQTGLKSFGLSRFTTPQRNIGEILMHAGIPAPSIEGFMRLLHRRDNRQIDLTGDDFCSWVGQMPRLEASAKGLDVPTWRFLSEGGEVSADLVTRMLAVLYAISSPGHELESALAALPPHIAEEVRRLLVDGSFISARNHHESRQRSSGPQIVFREGQVQVRLPSLEMILHEKVDWRLEIPGQTWIKQVGARWEGDPVTATFEPIPGPQTEITVSVIGRDLQWTLQIIDLNSQIMAFDSGNDVLIPPRNALPKNRVWIAFPNETDAEVSEALDVAGNIQIVHQPNTPYGWGGWTFALVDLSDVRHFNKKSAENLRARFVSAIERPTIEASTPADFIRAEVGLPIFTRRPYVTLPPSTQEGASVDWTVSVRDSNGALFSSTSFNVSTETVTINPWGLDKRLLVGTYVIDIRGALGRGASFKVNLAEGLTATSNTDFRWFTARGGLERAEVTVSIGGFKQVASLAEKDASRALSINLGEATLSAIVEIDHLSVSVESSNGSSAPSIGPVTIDIENLPTSILHIHAVRGQYACVNLIASRDVHQRIDVVANSAGAIKIPLAGFADTARSLGSSELFFVMDGRSCRVAQIQPRKLLNGVNLISDTVTVDKTSENLDIELILRVDYAPWNVPAQVRLSPGTSSVELPERLLSRGPLTVIARTYDPWNRDSIGHLEEVWSGNYFKLDQSINPKLSSLEDEFVRWIGGTATCPSSFEALEFAIDNYGSFAHVRSVAHSSYLLRDVAEMTLTHGSRVLDVAREARWSRKTHTRLLAEGWPATAASGDEPTNPATWRVSPFLGLLESLDRKYDHSLDGLVSSSLGEAALCILNEGIDPWPKAGYLGDRNIARLADRPRVEAESLWRRIAAIPGPLLAEDQRTIHAKSLFDCRDSIDLQGLINGTRQVVQETTELLQTKFDDHALYPLRARHAPDNWQSLPMASLALALTARLAARGMEDAADSYHFRRPWFATLADHAPEFVEQDLILAELWLHRWENE